MNGIDIVIYAVHFQLLVKKHNTKPYYVKLQTQTFTFLKNILLLLPIFYNKVKQKTSPHKKNGSKQKFK